MLPSPVSVVIPVLDRADLVARALDSVFSQSYRPIRLIVVDNGSSDSTPDVVDRWIAAHRSPDFEAILIHEPSPGAAAARNRGLQEVDSDWTLFFDSDDVMHPDLIESAMTAATDADIVCWQTAAIYPDGRRVPRRFSSADPLQRHLFNAQFCTVAYAVRTRFIRDCGTWNPILSCWDDFELGLRLLAASPRIDFIDRVLVDIYPQTDSITGTDFHSKAGKWELALSEMETFALTLPYSLRMRVLRMLCYRRVNLAALYAREGHAELGRKLRDATFVHPLYHSKSISGSPLNLPDRLVLRLIYHYTRFGGRGAYRLWSLLSPNRTTSSF